MSEEQQFDEALTETLRREVETIYAEALRYTINCNSIDSKVGMSDMDLAAKLLPKFFERVSELVQGHA